VCVRMQTLFCQISGLSSTFGLPTRLGDCFCFRPFQINVLHVGGGMKTASGKGMFLSCLALGPFLTAFVAVTTAAYTKPHMVSSKTQGGGHRKLLLLDLICQLEWKWRVPSYDMYEGSKKSGGGWVMVSATVTAKGSKIRRPSLSQECTQ
jgi:hypothetical protein